MSALTTPDPSQINASRDAAQLLAHVQQVWDRIRPNSSIYAYLLSDVRLVSATPGTVIAHLPLTKEHVNSRRTLHGAVSATIVDWAGGMAIASMEKAETGVSTDIHVSYLAAAREGDVLEIVGKVNRLGRTLGFTAVEIAVLPKEESKQRAIVCTASHTKYVGGATPRTESAPQSGSVDSVAAPKTS
jgi:acyl-coenzyme A thioesterase 13